MEYTDFRVDFVNRTIDILNDLSDKTDKEVTLLINCLFGLIVIPTEIDYLELNANYDKDFVDFCTKKLDQLSKIEKKTNPKKLAKCIKNALSHLYIEPISENSKISFVRFKDREDRNADFHTIIKFTVDDLKQFALEIAYHYLDIIQKRKRAK